MPCGIVGLRQVAFELPFAPAAPQASYLVAPANNSRRKRTVEPWPKNHDNLAKKRPRHTSGWYIQSGQSRLRRKVTFTSASSFLLDWLKTSEQLIVVGAVPKPQPNDVFIVEQAESAGSIRPQDLGIPRASQLEASLVNIPAKCLTHQL